MSPAQMEHLALVYFGGLSSSFLYTGGIGLKYIALGDICVLVFFGPFTVLFSYLAQTGHAQWATIYYALPLAMSTEAIVHANNTQHIKSDGEAGIVTLAILLGPSLSQVFFAVLLFTPYIMLAVVSLHYSKWLMLPLMTLPTAFNLEREFRKGTSTKIPKSMAKLNLYFGLFFVLSCALSDSSLLPRIS